ncbi:hypothetical protein MVEN_01197000 [Mycena venus]|uniref:Uncharacterized protein n=1 Tax=Mycena venus TaxID=2733690 RepID=A0A8H7CYQ6_9AGAR|nr:hypothetical protein MVEN_01197000 [Mycena venus]
MPAATEATGPSYISSHSADVILSDIRPIKLKLEGLRSINVLLDEFLFNILNTSRSLSTDKLRAGLLTILPTSLGKEALLEAEVELRAYWDRTPRPAVLEDDAQTFNLQWAFELLRLKCEAYSTLNETDEDSTAVARLQEKMTQLGGTTPPIPALVAPASLYLTAILESMCEHILSNVGRVAARDSSRTGATVQDVFVALCEDHSIYALFKSMRVYQQIEQLSQAPKPRRSKSFSRSDRPSISQNSTSNQDLPSSGRDSSTQHRSRGSTDTTTGSSTTATMPVAASSSRSSFDKARKKLMSTASRNSSDRDGDSQNGHKRSESVVSDDTKQTMAYEAPPEDTAMLKEFDNLMRSDSTMKVSLTPDRLKTMEVYKQEKDQRGNRRPPPLAFGKGEQSDSSSTHPSRANGRRPSLRHVDSIVEAEEEMPSKSAPTPRKTNVTSPNLPSTSTTSFSSTSNSSASRVVPRKSSRSNVTSPPSETTPPMPSAQPKRGPSGPTGFDPSGFPAKTRRIQKNREDMDIDDIMAGSDDDEELASAPAPRTPSKVAPSTPKRNPTSPHAVSASTRELMDFLAEGPPDVPKVSVAGREMLDFLAQGPPDQGGIVGNGTENGKKGSGRLQRMMSKLAMGTSERSRSQPSEDFGRGNGNNKMPPTTPVRTTAPGLAHQTSYGNLANRPVPPRPPPVQPISPPSSPSEEEYGTASTRSRKPSRRAMPTWEQQMADGQAPPAVPGKGEQNGSGLNGSINGHSRPTNGHAQNGVADEQATPRSRRPSAAADSTKRALPKPVVQTTSQASPTTPRKSAPTPSPVRAPAPAIAEDHARDMRRLLSKATSADECRLLFEMFLAKSGVPIEPAAYEVPYPSPSSSETHPTTARDPAEVTLELSLVELFLGGLEPEPAPRKRRTKKKSEPAVACYCSSRHTYRARAGCRNVCSRAPQILRCAWYAGDLDGVYPRTYPDDRV